MLSGFGVFAERGDGRYELTPMADALRADAPDSMRGIALLMGHPLFWEDWGHLLDSVRTGEASLPGHRGMSAFEYLGSNPEFAGTFFQGMGSMSAPETDTVIAAHDFSRYKTIIDVGGGRGGLLAGILNRADGSRGVLYDAPHNSMGADEVLKAAGVADRTSIEHGSYFETVPAGGDAYLLKHTLHDFSEAQILAVLKNIRDAIKPDGALYVIEYVLPGRNSRHIGNIIDLWLMLHAARRQGAHGAAVCGPSRRSGIQAEPGNPDVLAGIHHRGAPGLTGAANANEGETMDADVIVVGAGPVGLMLAGELRLGGADVIVLERNQSRGRESRGVGFTARATEVFHQRGLLARFDNPEISRLGHFGGIPMDFGVLEGSHFGVRGIPQYRIEEMLEAWALELGVSLRRGHTVTDLRADADQVTAVADGPDGQTEYSAQYLVGCDGGRSTVRQLAGFDFPGSDATREMYLADIAGRADPAAHDRRAAARRHGHGRPAGGRRLPHHHLRERHRAEREPQPELRRCSRRLAAADRRVDSRRPRPVG